MLSAFRRSVAALKGSDAARSSLAKSFDQGRRFRAVICVKCRAPKAGIRQVTAPPGPWVSFSEIEDSWTIGEYRYLVGHHYQQSLVAGTTEGGQHAIGDGTGCRAMCINNGQPAFLPPRGDGAASLCLIGSGDTLCGTIGSAYLGYLVWGRVGGDQAGDMRTIVSCYQS